MKTEKEAPADRLTLGSAERVWRDPRFLFHNETTGWYELAVVGELSLMARCTQNCKIEFGGGATGYDVPIPGSYTLYVELDRESAWGYENVAKAQVSFEGVHSHATLRRLATRWIVHEFPFEFLEEGVRVELFSHNGKAAIA